MTNTRAKSALTAWTNRALIGLFFLLLWLPTLDIIFHLDWTIDRGENRQLAIFPKSPSGGRELQAYLAALETYFNDHFGCRKCLVQWNNKLKWSLFKDKNTRNVLIGKNNWFFISDAQMIDHYSGLLQFTPEQLHDWQALLEKRRDWFARRGIAYLFVVAPDKQSIYPEDLPDWVTKVRPQTKLDQFFAYMRAHSTVPVLDLRETVRAAKQTDPTFLKTDTHWNFFGGFVAYQELVRTLAKQLPGLEPMPLATFTLTNRLQPGGDLAKNIAVNVVESNAYFLDPKPGLPSFTRTQAPPDHPKNPKFSYNPQAQGRVIVFQDSFAMCWMPFLGYHFNQVTYLWQYYLDPGWIERDKPVAVVNEMLERFFNLEDPKKLMAEDALK